jgi:hypothetical protein
MRPDKYVHVCAIIWVGGAFFAQLLAIRAARRRPDRPAQDRASIAYLGQRVFLPASILLFVAGIILVSQRWAFSNLWVSISMVLWLVSALVGALYLGPTSAKVGAVFAAEGPTSVAGRAGLDRLFLVARLELVSFAIVVFMMVVKPG